MNMENKNKKYKNPELIVVDFANDDIITNSEPWENGDEYTDD